MFYVYLLLSTTVHCYWAAVHRRVPHQRSPGWERWASGQICFCRRVSEKKYFVYCFVSMWTALFERILTKRRKCLHWASLSQLNSRSQQFSQFFHESLAVPLPIPLTRFVYCLFAGSYSALWAFDLPSLRRIHFHHISFLGHAIYPQLKGGISWSSM